MQIAGNLYLLAGGLWQLHPMGKLAGDFPHHNTVAGGKAAVGVDNFGNQQADIFQTVNIQI